MTSQPPSPDKSSSGISVRKGQIIVLAVVVVLTALAGLMLLKPLSSPVVEGHRDQVRLAIAMQPTDALTFIALENGYFDEVGLDVVGLKYPSGKRALLEGLFTGKADLASSADVPVAMAGLANKEFKILTAFFSADNVNRVIVRKDRDISSARDLEGKVVATQRASAVHFFMHLYFLEHGIDESKVDVRFMKAEFLPKSLAAGEIDAFSMREPYISQARELLGDNAEVFSAPGAYVQRELLVGSPNFVAANPQAVGKLLKGLFRAEAFVQNNPAKAIEITAQWLGVSEDKVGEIWPTVSFRMDMSQSLLMLLENEARWAIENNISTAKDVPYYLDYIDTSHLKKLKPQAVTIIK